MMKLYRCNLLDDCVILLASMAPGLLTTHCVQLHCLGFEVRYCGCIAARNLRPTSFGIHQVACMDCVVSACNQAVVVFETVVDLQHGLLA